MGVRIRRCGLAGLVLLMGATSAAPAQRARIHVVRPGETLWSIAADRIGDPTLWPALYRANRDQIRDPARLYPGQRLTIPTLDRAEREAVRREARSLGSK